MIMAVILPCSGRRLGLEGEVEMTGAAMSASPPLLQT